jgi:hypothetical protein
LEEINDAGGVSIICHPFWKPIYPDGRRMDTPMNLYLDLGKKRKFDGIEIVSGSKIGECHVSNMQEILSREMLKSFEGVPVIGITDSHYYSSDEIAGKHFTVIFVKERTPKAILEAIKEGWTVAVEMVNETAQCYGTLRLTMFAQFLVNYYFLERDNQAYIEGQAMKRKLEK